MDEPVLRLGPADAEEMAALHLASFIDGWHAADFRKLLDNPSSRAFGVEAAGGLSAFILLTLVHEEAEIITICTAPAERGKGLAGRILRAAIGTLAGEGAEKIFLDVAEDNLPAVKLYARCGFIRYGRREGYYHGVDAVLMLRHI